MNIYSILSGIIAILICATGNSASIDVLFNANTKKYYVSNVNISAGELRNTSPQSNGVFFSYTSPAGSIECRQGSDFTACQGGQWGSLPVYCPSSAEAIRRFKMMITGAILSGAPSANTQVEIACMAGPTSSWRFSGPVSPPTVLPASCKIDGPITLDHYSISAADVNGNTSTAKVEVECSNDSDIILKLPNKGIIPLDKVNNLHSEISLNGVKGGNVRVTKVGTTGQYVTVSSVLTSTSAVVGGEFSGSSVITLEVP